MRVLLLLLVLLAALPAWAADSLITSVAWAPDGRTLVTGHAEGEVWLWDSAAGSQVRPLAKHAGFVFGVAFRPDGSVVSWAQDGSVHVEGRDGTLVASFRVPDGLLAAALSPDGRTVAVGGYDRVTLWSLDAGRQLRDLGVGLEPGGVLRFRPDGKVLAVTTGPTGLVFDTATGRRLGKLQKDAVFDLTDALFTPEGTLLTLDQHSVREWRLPSGKPIRELVGLAFDEALRLTLSRDGRKLLASGWSGDRGVGRFWSDRRAGGRGTTITGTPLGFLEGDQILTRAPRGESLLVGTRVLLEIPPAAADDLPILIPPRMALNPAGDKLAFAHGSSLKVLSFEVERR